MLKAPFPEVLDSTIMAAFKSCPHKSYLEFIEHWKLLNQSVHLHAGAAYATGQEVTRKAFYEGIAKVGRIREEEGKRIVFWEEQRCPSHHAALAIELGVQALLTAYGDFECPSDSAKSATRTAGALEYYYSHYRLGEDQAIPITLPGGKLGIEFSFLEPLGILHPVTGNPLLYSGRMDMMCNYEGMNLGEDDKTASQLGASWPRQWDLRSQFTGYVWGAARAGIKLDGFLVRGVSILKTKYDTLEAITYRPVWQIDRWEEQLGRDIKRMIAAWEEGYWDWNLDHACSEYGGCPFRGVCQMREPEALLHQQFERRRWDPVARTETPLPLAWPNQGDPS